MGYQDLVAFNHNKTFTDSLLKDYNGEQFLEAGSFHRVLKWYACSVFGFAMVFQFYHILWLNVIKYQKYIKFNSSEKSYFLSTFSANTHHVVIIYYVIQALRFPEHQTLTYPYAWVYEWEIFLKGELQFCCVSMISLGYLTFDFGIQLFYI